MSSLRLRTEKVRWQEVDGQAVVFDMGQHEYFYLNPAGDLLWRRLGEGTSREELIECICEAFGVEEGRAATDVEAFLDEMHRRGLLTDSG